MLLLKLVCGNFSESTLIYEVLLMMKEATICTLMRTILISPVNCIELHQHLEPYNTDQAIITSLRVSSLKASA